MVTNEELLKRLEDVEAQLKELRSNHDELQIDVGNIETEMREEIDSVENIAEEALDNSESAQDEVTNLVGRIERLEDAVE